MSYITTGAHPVRVYANIEAYYTAVPAARRSGESDYGVWWRDQYGATWRVSYVHATGEIYIMRQGHAQVRDFNFGSIFMAGDGNEGPVLVLKRIEPFPPELESRLAADPAESVLEGWAQACGGADSLQWVFRRLGLDALL